MYGSFPYQTLYKVEPYGSGFQMVVSAVLSNYRPTSVIPMLLTKDLKSNHQGRSNSILILTFEIIEFFKMINIIIDIARKSRLPL